MGVLREAKTAASEGATAPSPPRPALTRVDTLVDSYRRLADVFHDVLSAERLNTLLERIADTLGDLVPYDTFTIYQADEARRCLIPLMARDTWADEIMRDRPLFGQGITGWAVEHREPQLVNQAHLDPRVKVVPGTPPDEPEALITIPLVARDAIKGALNIYRLGEKARFTEEEFELAKRFGDAAALALDNAQVRETLELQAQTDSLTGLYNHRYFHDRLRAELTRATRAHDPLAVLMLDIDDFKRVNDVHGHGTGDQVLVALADLLRGSVRLSDVVCRLGGEEFGIIMSPCDPDQARGLASRLLERVEAEDFAPADRLTLSIGIAQGPEHASNPRELGACAEAAMMTAKARGKNQAVLFAEDTSERPDASPPSRDDVRSVAHLKMLQSLAGKLNRLNDVREIGSVIVNELRMLVDYHSCRVYIADGDDLNPISWRGNMGPYVDESAEALQSKFGEGITGTAASTGRSLLIANALDCDYAVTIPGTDDIEESMIAVPLKYGARVIGVVTISKLGTGQFDEDDVRLLEVLAGHASVALENARLYEAQRNEAENAKESLEIANALLEFSRELAAAEGLDEVLAGLVDLAASTLAAERASVWLQEAATGDLVVTAVCGHDEEAEARLFDVRFSSEVAHDLLSSDQPYVLSDGEVAKIEGAPSIAGKSLALAPLHLDGDRLGCVAAVADPGHFETSERRMRLLAGIAHQAKLAIQNARSFQSLEETFLSTVEALANALEANDEYTSSHARWITDMALEVGRELGLDAKTLKRLELGALFHDIGKIGIPQTILSKAGPLTPEERAVIETHPELGERILSPISRLEDVRPIVRHAHERWDGNGYPDQRAAEDIPIESRVILVCDAFHAMTTDRPYRGRLPVEEAFRRLRENAGTQFDPKVVEVFLKLAPDALGDHPV
ncbi:MAG TPA: diguanylate cyclase [Gaiellaceae bacterium]|nr:diguanylate cyclase [Gaiellaceae bacterium]